MSKQQFNNEMENFVDDSLPVGDNRDLLRKSDNDDTAESVASPAPDIWTWGLHPLGLGYVPHVRKRQRLYLRKSSGQLVL